MRKTQRRVKLYRTVMLDPPWPENGGGKIKRGADRHYETITVRRMPEVILSSGRWHFYEHAHLYMWATNNYLLKAGWLIEQLGFRYVTNLPWVKSRAGLGQYFRGQHELLLFAVRGKGKDPSVYQDRRDLTTVVKTDEHSRIHSRKPQAFIERIEARSKGPYLELFSDLEGETREGWDRFGKFRIKPGEVTAG